MNREKLIKIGAIILKFVIKITSKINFRLVVAIFVGYVVVKVFFMHTALLNMKKNVQSENIIQSGTNLIKEIKETAIVTLKVVKSLGLDNVSAGDLVKQSSSREIDKVSVIKREDKGILHKNERVIPLCGAEINANIIGRDNAGVEFFNNAIDFKLGDFLLPVGLEKSITKMTSSYEYDVILPIGQMYFIDKPKDDFVGLKNLNKNGAFVTYEVTLNKISKSFPVSTFEPRVFYLSHGIGDDVFCDASVKIAMKITDLDGKIISTEHDYVINIGYHDIPYGLEHILMRLRVGDKISVMLNSAWLKTEKGTKYRITLPNEKYMIFDIAVHNIKKSNAMFRASKDIDLSKLPPEIKTNNVNDIIAWYKVNNGKEIAKFYNK